MDLMYTGLYIVNKIHYFIAAFHPQFVAANNDFIFIIDKNIMYGSTQVKVFNWAGTCVSNLSSSHLGLLSSHELNGISVTSDSLTLMVNRTHLVMYNIST